MCARGAAISGYVRGSRCGGARDIHLIDGTYESFRHYCALPSARDWEREVDARYAR